MVLLLAEGLQEGLTEGLSQGVRRVAMLVRQGTDQAHLQARCALDAGVCHNVEDACLEQLLVHLCLQFEEVADGPRVALDHLQARCQHPGAIHAPRAYLACQAEVQLD